MSRQLNDDNMQGYGITTPHDHDILSGRGNFVNYHPGNEHFRALVRKHKIAYVACPKSMKGKFADMIVDEIKQLNPPGRFLKQDEATKLWYDIGDKKALDKTRQALREGAPEIQKVISVDENTDPSKSETLNGVLTNMPNQSLQERRGSTGNIDPSYSLNNQIFDRRASTSAVDPSFVVGNRNSHDATPREICHLGQEYICTPQQNIQMPMQDMMMLQHHTQDHGSASIRCGEVPVQTQNDRNNMSASYSPAMRQPENSGYSMNNRDIFSNAATFGSQTSPLMTINETQGQRYSTETENYHQNQNQHMNHGYATNHGDLYFSPTFVNPVSSLMTINESQGQPLNTDTGLHSQPQNHHQQAQYQMQTPVYRQTNLQQVQSNGISVSNNSQYTSSPNQQEYHIQLPSVKGDPYGDQSNRREQKFQSTSITENGVPRRNQALNTINRTYKVRPEPIQLHGSGQDGPSAATVARRMYPIMDKPEGVHSASSNDQQIMNRKKEMRSMTPKQLRAITPRRMIINVQHSDSRSISPRRMTTNATNAAELVAFRYSPTMSNRSRSRARQDSTRSIAFEKIFDTACDSSASAYKSKSSGGSFLSIMSLSINDVLAPSDELEYLGPLFDESVKISNASGELSSVAPTNTSIISKAASKGNDSNNDIMRIDKRIYHMSVNTISDTFSEYSGNDGINRMGSSENDMSFIDVFDEQETDDERDRKCQVAIPTYQRNTHHNP